jgi:Ca2+-binding EF-hand superfamily protein
LTTPEEQAIQGVIDQIWATYDVDNSGALDKEETKKFVKDTFGNLSGGDEFSDEAFDEVFATFDKDGSGTVEKAEMVVFIKQLLG